jgi:copper transport protein
VPDDQVQLGESEPPAYRVSARVSPGGRAPATAALRPCGPGCFVGPVPWRNGTSYLDIRVDADGWTGGAAAFPVSWPPQIERGILPRVRAAILTQRSIQVVETVTSETTRPAPRPRTVNVSGREVLDSDPYGSPPDPDVAVQRLADGHTILSFGLPAEGTHVLLETDAAFRIVRETLAAPKHLTQRTFTYR